MTTSFGSATPNPTSKCDSRPCKTFAVGGPLIAGRAGGGDVGRGVG
jgi:hypothetical protein